MPKITFEDIISHPEQAYFTRTQQIYDVIESVLSQVGKSDLMISTFSTSEEFIRRIYRKKTFGEVGELTLFCDNKASRKTINLYKFIKNVFNAVFLCENHSKVVLLTGGSREVAIISSQNQTRGNRFECGIITANQETIQKIKEGFTELQSKSILLDDFFRRTDKPD